MWVMRVKFCVYAIDKAVFLIYNIEVNIIKAMTERVSPGIFTESRVGVRRYLNEAENHSRAAR